VTGHFANDCSEVTTTVNQQLIRVDPRVFAAGELEP